jgi:periplasmic protein TonB
MSELYHPRHLSPALWSVAGIVAIALHAGGVGLILFSEQPEDEPDLGAPAIEIGVELAAPELDPTVLPVGPYTEAAAPSPAMVEQKAMIEHTDLPKATPTETEDPDRVVSPNQTEKPKEEEPKIVTMPTPASTESVASEATAPPDLQQAPEATFSVAPTLGTGESARRERATWQKELAAHLDKYKRYPPDRALQNAEVIVSFVLDRLGHVVSKHIVKGSGDSSFDAAALDMLQRSDPVPPPPPLVADEGLAFSLPVIFQVKKGQQHQISIENRRRWPPHS